jgi:hypothetical protein
MSDYNNAAIVATVDRKEKLKFGQPYYHMWWKYLEHKMVPNLVLMLYNFFFAYGTCPREAFTL